MYYDFLKSKNFIISMPQKIQLEMSPFHILAVWKSKDNLGLACRKKMQIVENCGQRLYEFLFEHPSIEIFIKIFQFSL